MLEGSHGMARDAEAAVALLEEKVKDGDAEAMWMLGVCCEFGIGTEQNVERSEQLYERGVEQGNATANLLMGKLWNWYGRGCTYMDLESEQREDQQKRQNFANQLWWWTGKDCSVEGLKALASMLLMHVPLAAMYLRCKTAALLDMILVG